MYSLYNSYNDQTCSFLNFGIMRAKVRYHFLQKIQFVATGSLDDKHQILLSKWNMKNIASKLIFEASLKEHKQFSYFLI